MHEAPAGDEEEPPPPAAPRTPATSTTPREGPDPMRMALSPVVDDAAAPYARQDAGAGRPGRGERADDRESATAGQSVHDDGRDTRPPPAPPASPTAPIDAWMTGDDGLAGLTRSASSPEEARAPTPILGPLDDLDLLGMGSRDPGLEKASLYYVDR